MKNRFLIALYDFLIVMAKLPISIRYLFFQLYGLPWSTTSNCVSINAPPLNGVCFCVEIRR